MLRRWVELTGWFLQARSRVYCVKSVSALTWPNSKSQHMEILAPSVRCTTVEANYSSWMLWRGKIAWQIVPWSSQGSERDETDYEEISGNMGPLAEETDKCFYFLPSFVLLFVCLKIICRCCAIPNRFFRWKYRVGTVNWPLKGCCWGKCA